MVSKIKGKRKDPHYKIREEIRGYGYTLLFMGVVILFISLIPIYVAFSLPLLVFLIPLCIGCALNIYSLLYFRLNPYIVGSTVADRRVLEPYELNVNERRVLSYIDSEHGRRIIKKTTIVLYFIAFLSKIISSLLKTQKPEDNLHPILGMLSMSFPIFLLWVSSGTISLAMIMFSASKNWDLILATIEPWPIDKPFGRALFKKSSSKGIEYYTNYLRKLKRKDEMVSEFLETHSIETLSLFLSPERFSLENLKRIVEIENLYDYFEFLEKIGAKYERFQSFRFGDFLNAFHRILEEELEKYYGIYEQLLLKAEGELAEVIWRDSFEELFDEHREFILDRLEKDSKWREKVDKMLQYVSKSYLSSLIKELPDTSFGRELKLYIERFLENKPSKKRKKGGRKDEIQI